MIFKKIPNRKKSASKAMRTRALSSYIAQPERENGIEKCIHFGSLNFVCSDFESQQAEMLSIATESTKSADPINHYVLSWKRNERPTPAQADEAVAILVDQLGLDGCQVIYGLHDDTENMHLHVMVNRVHPLTGKAVEINKGFDKRAGHQAIARIEKQQGWSKEANALYEVSPTGKVIKRAEKAKPESDLQPGDQQQAFETRIGEKSGIM